MDLPLMDHVTLSLSVEKVYIYTQIEDALQSSKGKCVKELWSTPLQKTHSALC